MYSIIVDLDGTLCDNSHRVHHVKNVPKNWDAFHDACVDDVPHEYLITLLRALSVSFDIILCSGRPNSHHRRTVDWLEKHGVWWKRLYMRNPKDFRPDTVIKREMLDKMRSEGFTPLLAIDDRPSVIKMWRENGIPCLAVDDKEWEGSEK